MSTPTEEVFAALARTPPRTGGWHHPDAIPLTAFYDPATDDVYMTEAERELLRILADPPPQGAPTGLGSRGNGGQAPARLPLR